MILRRRSLAIVAAVCLVAIAGCVPAAPATPIADGVTVPSSLVEQNPMTRVANGMVRFRTTACDGVFVGSGFATGPHTVVTNRHVVGGADTVAAETWDGIPLHITSVKISPDHDLAIVTVSDTLPVSLSLAPEEPNAGMPVTLAGYPRAKALAFSTGSVIEDINGQDLYGESRVVLTTAKVQHGNSGGPMVNALGIVVGIVFAVTVGSNTGLAIPVSTLHTVLDNSDLEPNPACHDYLVTYGRE